MAILTTNINYLQPTSFKLVIDRENYPNLEYFAQSISHPSMTVTAAELPFRKFRSIPMPGESLDFGEFSAQIIIDEDMTGYSEMYGWLTRLVEQNLKGALDRSDDVVPATSDITLSILSSHNNTVKQIRYIGAIPTSLGEISFEATAAGTEFLTFSASFRFSHFEIV